MALTYNKDIRDLSIKGTITTNTGVQIHLTPDEIINYSFDSQIGSEGLPLGSAESSSFSLEFSNSEHAYTPSMFDNAEVHMFIGIHDGSDYVYSDFGVWYVDTSTAPEQSVSISLSGYDALATRFESTFVDDKNAYPTTIGDIAETVCLAAGIRLKSNAFPNAAIKVSKIPAWGDDITLRDILSYCAICAGGYVRIARNGQLEIVGFGDGQTYEMDPDTYQTFTLTGGSAFKFNSIEAMMSEDAESYTRFAIDGSVVSDATNTIQIEYNPLLTNSIIQSVMNELKGIEMDAGSLTWGGDPSVQCTDYYAVTMIDGTVKKIMVTSQSFSVDGGMIVTETCELPSKNAVGSPTYSTSTNMYDAKGNIKATRIAGLDNKIIKATTGHFNNLTAETIEADALTVALLNALDLKAKNIDAESLTTDQLTALVANIVEGTIKRLNAGAITTDELYAAFAELIALKAKSITANNILTDEFAAEFAKITVLAAGNATFDKATIQHLVAQAMNLEYGVAGQVFIKNLAVEYAQMVSAAVGELCIKASDGNYYLMDVNPDGTVTATKTTVSNGEINAGQTSNGQVILETNITAANLNTGNLLATYALINQIDAARIDVDQLFAREAFINLLRTSKIISNKSIEMIAGEAEDAKTAANNAQASVDDLNRLTDIEVIEGTFVQAERREGEGIRIYSEVGPKQDKTYGDPYPAGGGKNLISPPVNDINGSPHATFEYDIVTSTFKVTQTSPVGSYYSQLYYELDCDATQYAGQEMTISYGEYSISNESYVPRVYVYSQDVSLLSTISPEESDAKTATFIVPDNCTKLRIIVRIDQHRTSDEGAQFTITNLQLELGSAATSFAPYANTPPIEGWTGLNGGVCGKNLCSDYSLNQIGWATLVPELTETLNTLPKGVYTLSMYFTAVNVPSASDQFGCVVADSDSNIIFNVQPVWGTTTIGTEKRIAATIDTTEYAVGRIYIYGCGNNQVGPTGTANINRFQLELGSSATSYAPYTGKTYALDFGETVYGGRVNWNKGEMLVGTDVVDMGTLEWVLGRSDQYTYFHATITNMRSGTTSVSQLADIYCEQYKTTSQSVWHLTPYSVAAFHTSGQNRILVHDPRFSTAEDLKASLSGVMLAYPLAEPYTIQLTPVQIESLEGINTVYTDADGGWVEFGHKLNEVIDSTMPPASATVGTLWLDRSVTPAVLRRYNGSDWEAVNDMSMLEEVQSALLTKQAELEAAQRESALFLKLDAVNKVVRIGQEKVTSEFLIDAFGSGVSVNNEIFSRFEANRAVFGYMEMRKPAVGGLAFDSIKT